MDEGESAEPGSIPGPSPGAIISHFDLDSATIPEIKSPSDQGETTKSQDELQDDLSFKTHRLIPHGLSTTGLQEG